MSGITGPLDQSQFQQYVNDTPDQKPAKQQKPYRPAASSPNINPAPLSVLPNNVPGLQAPSFKKGGVMKKTGPAKLHKGEKVLAARQPGRVNRLKVSNKDAKKGYRRSDALKDL